MSDPTDTNHRTPRSSSSTTHAGTRALRVTVENSQAEPQEESIADVSSAADTAPDAMQASDLPYGAGDAEPLPPPIETVAPDVNTQAEYPATAAAPEMPKPPAPAAVVEEASHAIEESTAKAVALTEAAQSKAAALFDQVSRSFKDAFSDAGQDAARITFTLMEFAQANARNNFKLAQDYAAVRSVPEIVNIQAAYFQRQMALMNQQADELRKLAAEITSKKAAQLQGRTARH